MRILESDPEIRVLGIVASASEALKFIARTKPDLITVDLELPGTEGLSFTREVMEKHPIPIVVVGSTDENTDTKIAFDLLEAGALATVERPVKFTNNVNESERCLIETIKTMAEIKLVRRIRRGQSGQSGQSPSGSRTNGVKANGIAASGVGINANGISTNGIGANGVSMNGINTNGLNAHGLKSDIDKPPIELVAIGASTGGPSVLQMILKGLPHDFPCPILIAQHIAPGFTNALVDWLATTTGFTVKICDNNDKLMPGIAYVCPEAFQTGLSPSLRVKLATEDCVHGVRPSVSYLFSSIAEIPGRRIAAVLLTGMGRDGAEELKILRDRGGVTIVQDAESSLVHGMPGEAIKLGAAQHVLPAMRISELLIELACRGK